MACCLCVYWYTKPIGPLKQFWLSNIGFTTDLYTMVSAMVPSPSLLSLNCFVYMQEKFPKIYLRSKFVTAWQVNCQTPCSEWYIIYIETIKSKNPPYFGKSSTWNNNYLRPPFAFLLCLITNVWNWSFICDLYLIEKVFKDFQRAGGILS